MAMTLAPPSLALEAASRTHVGLVRKQNEDSYFTRCDLGVFAVADGVGGLSAGDVASRTVVEQLETLGPAVSPSDLLARFEDRVFQANARVRLLARQRGAQMMATTLAALLVHGEVYACLWAGDSRVYSFRDGTLSQLSRDHTEAQELVDNGVLTPAQAKTWPRANVITRAIGISDEPDLDFVQGAVMDGDVFLICSDGLTKHVDDDVMRAVLAASPIEAAADTLLKKALDAGGTDNVTLIVARVRMRTAADFSRFTSQAAQNPPPAPAGDAG